jgi:hypothetical protein
MVRGYHMRSRPQTLQERLMPHTQFEALEARCLVRHEQGIDSNKLTINDDDDNNSEDAGHPQGEPALLDKRICKTTVDMLKRVLLFSQGAAEALYNNQNHLTEHTLRPH